MCGGEGTGTTVFNMPISKKVQKSWAVLHFFFCLEELVSYYSLQVGLWDCASELLSSVPLILMFWGCHPLAEVPAVSSLKCRKPA